MRRDFSSCRTYVLIALAIFIILFIAALYVGNCGFTVNCSPFNLPAIVHTPIPTLIPATLPNPTASTQAVSTAVCTLSARDLLSSWVSAGFQETEIFSFVDMYGNVCDASFANVLPLFTRPNLWYPQAPSCDSCHNADISTAAANLDLSNYQGILAGAKRTSPEAKGEDILGGGVWESSVLNKFLFVYQTMPPDAPAGALTVNGPITIAGEIALIPTIAPTEGPVQEEVARPSNPGGPGEAVSLTGDPKAGETVYLVYCEVCHGPDGTDNVPNPGSDDETVPPLNPIDPTILNSDYATFAYNLDLFLQNGSNPEGPNAAYQMPAWGKLGLITQQQIADVIAYVISLNK
jgi:mono/diheme cytochrome c family protein